MPPPDSVATAGERQDWQTEIADPSVLVDLIERQGFEFLDFGCSRGGSIDHAKKVFSSRGEGLGIDIDSRKVVQAVALGRAAVNFDLLRLPDRPLVRFVTLIHFLEHVGGYSEAQAMLTKACRVARQFVYVAQPFFDADGALLEHGLKLYWSDWRGHRFPMSTLSMLRILRGLLEAGRLARFSILLFSPICSSDADEILPLAAGEDSLSFDPSGHPRKPSRLKLPFPVFREVRVIASVDAKRHDSLVQRVPHHHVLVDGRPGALRVSPVSWRELCSGRSDRNR